MPTLKGLDIREPFKAYDSTIIKILKSSNHHLQRRSHSTKIDSNGIAMLTASTLDGKAMFIHQGSACISPTCTDECMICFFIDVDDEFEGSSFHRILSALGLDDFFVVHMLDK